MTSIAKGHIINGPCGQGYMITRDVDALSPITLDLFEPINGSRPLESLYPIGEWLANEIRALPFQLPYDLACCGPDMADGSDTYLFK